VIEIALIGIDTGGSGQERLKALQSFATCWHERSGLLQTTLHL
jgi:hypothetical protein